MILEYEDTESHSRTFKYFDRKKLWSRKEDRRMNSSMTNDEQLPALTLAVCPENFGVHERVRTECKINMSLYEANGRDWYVEYVLLGPRECTQLYFPKTEDFSYLTSSKVDSIFINGLINGIDRLAENGDTLYSSVEGWTSPYGNQGKAITAIEEWINRNRLDYLINTDWSTRIKSGSRALIIFGDEDLPTFGLSDFHLWPRLDDGTTDGRIFRDAYEKACKELNLNFIDDKAVWSSRACTDADIDLYLEWNFKKWNYYKELPNPIVNHVINSYSNTRNVRLYDTLEICEQ